MNTSKQYQHILDNFILSGEAQRLVYSILSFVRDEYGNDPVKAKDALSDLLDGIGIEDSELDALIDQKEV